MMQKTIFVSAFSTRTPATQAGKRRAMAVHEEEEDLTKEPDDTTPESSVQEFVLPRSQPGSASRSFKDGCSSEQQSVKSGTEMEDDSEVSL